MTAPHWQTDGCSTVSAMIFVDEVEQVMAFAQQVFGAEPVTPPLRHQDGSLWHTALKIGDSTVMLGKRPEGMPVTTAFLHIYVPDVDATFDKAVAAGAKSMMPVGDQFYGERAGGVMDAQGNVWWVSTQTEALPFEEIKRRAAAFERDKGAAA
ncbi:MAG: VOC family protein [Pseudomonadota bacterium]